jgi:crotonobetainyl-CoA:carnitine CoA-transferase CaiB-like acyl-CoA transferase
MLSPYRVLDLTDERGALAGLVLAALGAEVIAVEPADGSRIRRLRPFVGEVAGAERSLWHLAYNRGKRSVTVDSVDLNCLVGQADALVECGALPVDLAALREANPALVTVSITPFGRSGSKSGWAATDLVVLAASGTLVLSGDEDRAPVRFCVPQAWLHAASDAACGAVLALLERERSGIGQHVDISAQVSAAQATQSYILSHSYHARSMARSGGGYRLGDLRSRSVWPAADGYVFVILLFGSAAGPFTARLLAWIYEAGFCDEAIRDLDCVGFGAELLMGKVSAEFWDELKGVVARFTSSMTKQDLFAGALERRLLIAPVATAQEVLASDQLDSRDFWERIEVDQRPVRVPKGFARLSSKPLRTLGPPPRLGQHNELIPTRLRPHPPASPAAMRERPLTGVKVVDLTWAVAGPTVTRVMADFGATVVRVESGQRIDTARTLGPFWRDGVATETSALYQNMNAGKFDIALDLASPEGREVLCDLIRRADVLTESFTPGVMAQWGLDYDGVRQLNPEIVMMSSCLMGQTGPLSRFSGYGGLAAALCGFTAAAGWPDRPPVGPFMAYTDYISPRLALVTLLAALDHRRRRGEGQYIDFSQGEAALHFLTPLLLDYEINGRLAVRAGNTDLNMSPHGVYPAAGPDTWVAIACENDQQWQTLAAVIGRDDLAALTTSERLVCQEELDAALSAWSGQRDQFDVQNELQSVAVPAHVVQNSPECRNDPQLLSLGHFVTTDHAELGQLEVEGTRIYLSDTPAEIGPAPTLGQHLLPLLETILGYEQDQITRVLMSGALQ